MYLPAQLGERQVLSCLNGAPQSGRPDRHRHGLPIIGLSTAIGWQVNDLWQVNDSRYVSRRYTCLSTSRGPELPYFAPPSHAPPSHVLQGMISCQHAHMA